MSSELPRKAQNFEATYYREYGIHEVENGSSTDYLASFPNWDEFSDAISAELPERGRIITPEYITAPDRLEDIRTSAELIRARIEFAKSLTRQTDAELYLGTPYILRTPGNTTTPPGSTWVNSILKLQHGNVTGITQKTFVLDVEKEAGISPARTRERTIRNGLGVLICAELYDYPASADAMFKALATEIIAPTMWATPADKNNPPTEAAFNRVGGKDNYYRSALELIVGQYTLRNLPNVNRVVTVDRGRPDLAPYNAVFTRADTNVEERRAA